jgi:hypothetical protein
MKINTFFFIFCPEIFITSDNTTSFMLFFFFFYIRIFVESYQEVSIVPSLNLDGIRQQEILPSKLIFLKILIPFWRINVYRFWKISDSTKDQVNVKVGCSKGIFQQVPHLG